MAKDRSFAAKMAKGTDKDQEEQIQTVLLVKPVKSEEGHYKFKRTITKLTPENKKALGV
ncbi:MAG: hypothetical protein OXD39_07880 [Gemmatimonadetes bacterium]|nr:hypothetical protein [Gemmatimonadota bacterium]